MLIDIHQENGRGDIITLRENLLDRWRGRVMCVPIGFECDGVSVPRCLWRLVSPQLYPTTLRGGVIHDWLYRRQPGGLPRREADRLFLCRLIEDGTAVWRALLAYCGVRWFGGIAWRKNQKF